MSAGHDSNDCRRTLLAVDIGVRTGLALYNEAGRLEWYRSQNFGQAGRLRRAVPGFLRELPAGSLLVLEGGGHLADIWKSFADRYGLVYLQVQAEEWRSVLLPPRNRRSGTLAKHSALVLARQVIEWSGAKRPTSLRDDAAEAILVGFWGVLKVGWLQGPALAEGASQVDRFLISSMIRRKK